MRFWMALLVICLLPTQGISGAWPRGKGEVFLSFGYQVSGDPALLGTPGFTMQGYSTAFLEYGLSPRLTFGVDAGLAQGGDHSVIAFARTPIRPGMGTDPLAVQIGIGTMRQASARQTLVQLGASWGRGIATRLGDGWLSLDISAQHWLGARDTVLKADLTAGLKPSGRTMLMLQVQSGRYPGNDPFVRLAPSVVRQIGPGRHIELGLNIGLIGSDSVGIKLASWLEF